MRSEEFKISQNELLIHASLTAACLRIGSHVNSISCGIITWTRKYKILVLYENNYKSLRHEICVDILDYITVPCGRGNQPGGGGGGGGGLTRQNGGSNGRPLWNGSVSRQFVVRSLQRVAVLVMNSGLLCARPFES